MHSSRPFRRLFGSGPGIFAGRPRGSRRTTRTTPTAACERLEDRTLLSAVGPEELAGVVADQTPQIGISPVVDEDRIPPVDEERIPSQIPTSDAAPPFDLGETFQLHSNLGATKVIYLDFDGHVTSNTVWNDAITGGSDILTPAYSFEGDVSPNFTNGELERIQKIWQRVAEDFIPFDVDVTTQDPGTEALRNTGGSDNEWGVRVAIGGSWSDWYGSPAGGVAYVDVFGYDHAKFWDAPAFVFENNTGDGDEKSTTEAVSHEVGHTLGLHHDGTSTVGYYEGHGSGATGWAPIMGVGYYRELSQWSKGEYNFANETEDDLQIITTQNGFGYRADDHGGTDATATGATWTGDTLGAEGIIERNDDVDVFSFTTTGGQLDLDVLPFVSGPNLDILAELYDSAGNLVMASNPLDALHASFNLTLAAGEYFLRIDGTGKGDPLATGYTDYGSLGAYTVIGTVIPLTLSISLTTVSEIDGSSATTGTVTRFGDLSQDLVVQLASSDPSEAAVPATVTILAGQASATFNISAVDDNLIDGTQTVTISALAGGSLMADLTYGTNGVASADLFIQGSVLQSDGKLVVVGYRRDLSSPTFDNDVVVARFNTDGTLDTTFGADGTGTVVIQAIDGTERIENAITVALQSDGKIIVGGELYTSGNTNDAAGFLLRLDPLNGQIDGTFGIDGYVVFDPTNGLEKVWDLLVLPDDTILAAGEHGGGAALYHFASDGTLLTFPGGSSQLFVLSVPSDDPNPAGVGDDATTLVLQPDGKILVGGIVYGDHPNRVWGIARLTTDFQYDNTFGTDGRIIVDLPTTNERLEQLLLQPDGKIIAVGGGGGTYGNELRALARFNADGSLDDTFGEGGIVLTTMDENALGYAAHLLPDGSILVAGSGGAGNRGVVTRYSADGLLIEGATTLLHQYAGRSIVAALGGHVLVAGFGGDVEHFSPHEFATDANSLNVTDDDTIPQAVADTATTKGGTAVIINVLANDTDADGDPLTVILVSNPPGGTATINGDGTITYTPDENFNGADSFTYTIQDEDGQSDTATVAITVEDTNEPPTVDSLTVTISPSTISEPDGTATGTVTRTGDLSQEIVVQLTSSDTSEATVPATVTILAGQASANFTINAVDDALEDGTQTVTITASAPGTSTQITLDNAFGAAGHVDTRPAVIYDVAEQSDEKIVVTGYYYRGSDPNENYQDYYVARYNVDGTLDTTFGNNGEVIIDSGSNGDIAKAVAIQSDGKIVIAGRIQQSDTNNDFSVIRLNADGSFDTTFGTTGFNVYNTGPGRDEILDLEILANGDILAAGAVDVDDVRYTDFALMRINADGSIDTAFGNGGLILTNFQTGEAIRAIDVQDDGKIVAVGTQHGGNFDSQFAIARYTADGQLDTTFGTGGQVRTDLPNNYYENASDVVIQDDGKIIVVGQAGGADEQGDYIFPPPYDFALVRYNTDGTLDSSFGSGGISISDFGSDSDTASAVTLLPDGRIVVAGRGTVNQRAGIALYGTNGALKTSIFSADTVGSNAYAMTILNDGSVLIGGLHATSTGGFLERYAIVDEIVTATDTLNVENDDIINSAPLAQNDSYSVNEDQALTVGATGTPVLDQENFRDTGRHVFNAEFLNLQQQVRADENGQLTSIDVFVYESSAAGGVLSVFVNLGVPWQTDTPEFQTQYTLESSDIGNWITIDVSAANIVLQAGDLFTIGTSSAGSSDVFLLTTNSDVAGDSYAAGSLWVDGARRITPGDNDYDLLFRTRVAPVALNGLLANDTDPDGDPLTAVLVAGPAHGTLQLNADGSFTYTPDANYSGTDSFTYRASDGTTASDPVTVLITITQVNSPPAASPDSYTVNEDGTLQTTSATPALDQQTDTFYNFSATISGGLQHQQQVTAGTAGLLDSVDFYLANGTVGDTFKFLIHLGPAWQYDNAVYREDVVITAEMVNNWVTIDLQSAGIVLGAGDIFAFSVRASGSGSISLYGSSANPYSGGTSWTGSETSSFEDPDADFAFRTRMVPEPYPSGLLANDSDPDGDPLTAELVTGPAHGALTLNADGSFSYSPDANYAGTDSFTYRASDGFATSDPVTVSIMVEADHATPESLAITYVIPPPYPYLTEATGTTTGTITRTGDLSGDVVIQLTSSNPSKLSVPETVTIAAGQASANFTITLIDDNLLSGNEFITLTATSGSAVAGPLTLNESFGTAGLASTPLTFNWQPPYAVVATLPSGKVLAASEDATDGSWRLIRLNADGTLDTTFGNGGSVITAFTGSNGAVPRAIFVQTDGKILIGGESINELPGQAILARYNTDGTLDTSFYNGGINTLGGTDGWITDIAVHTNGKIYLAITGNSGFDFKVVRLTDRGFADNFGSGGVRTYSGTNAWASAITLTADGGFYLAGNNKVGKFDANGNPVFGFGSSGIATVDFGAPNENVVGIEELPDGRIVVGYYLHNGDNTTDFGAARLNTDGSLDASFSGDGLATVDFAGLDDYATSMALQNDGKIILAGFTEISDTEEDWAIARLDLDGNLDSSFDDDGLYTQSTRIGADRIFDIAVVGPKLIALGGWAGNMRVASYELPGVTVSTQRNIFVVDQEELTVSLSDTAFTEGDPVGVATMTITRHNTNIDEALVVTPVTGINGQIVDGFLILPESVTIAAGESSVTFEIGVADDIYVNGTREFQVAATAPNYLPNIIMASVADDDLGPFGQDNFLVATDAPGEIHEYMGDLLVRIFQIPTLETEFKELRDLAVDADGNLHFWEETFDSSGIRYELTTINPLTGSIVRHSLLPGWSTDSNVTYGGVATLNDWVFVTDMATSGGSQTGIIRYDRSTGTSVRFAESGSPALEFIDLTVGFDGLLYGLDISELVHVYDPATLVELRTINITQSVFPDNRAIAVNEAGDIFAAAWGDGLIRRFDGETGALLSTTSTSFGSLVDLDLRADGTLIASTRFNGIVVTDETLASVSNLSLDGDPSSPFVAFAATPPVVNLRPFANSSSFTTDEDAPHAGTLSGSDPESASLTYVRADGPAHGTLDFNADGTFTYTPAANYFGTDTFTFTVSDGNSTSMPATVSISVIGVNDAPTFDASSYDFSVAENSANNSAVGTVTASDVDNQPLNYSIIGGNDSGAFAIDAATGAITVADASKLDFETTQSFSLTVRVTDAMLADETTVVVVSLTDIVAPQVAVVEFGYGEDMWATAESLANRTAPWQITQIRIRFTQDVTVDINDLIVTGAAGNYEISEFVYNPTTFTAIWTLSSPIEQDRVTIALDGDSAAAGSDGNEGVHTDGEYLSDGDLLEALDILLGDADGDGRVDFNDMFATYQGIGQPYDPNKDLNGDGRVDFNDMFFAYRQIGRSLS